MLALRVQVDTVVTTGGPVYSTLQSLLPRPSSSLATSRASSLATSRASSLSTSLAAVVLGIGAGAPLASAQPASSDKPSADADNGNTPQAAPAEPPATEVKASPAGDRS